MGENEDGMSVTTIRGQNYLHMLRVVARSSSLSVAIARDDQGWGGFW